LKSSLVRQNKGESSFRVQLHSFHGWSPFKCNFVPILPTNCLGLGTVWRIFKIGGHASYVCPCSFWRFKLANEHTKYVSFVFIYIPFPRYIASSLVLKHTKFYHCGPTKRLGMLFLRMAFPFRGPLVQGWPNNHERNWRHLSFRGQEREKWRGNSL